MIKLTLINIRGGGPDKPRLIQLATRRNSPDLMIISETRELDLSEIENTKTANKKLAIISRLNPTQLTLHDELHKEPEKRYTYVTIKRTDDLPIKILAVYGPATQQDRPQFWKDLTSTCEDFDILAGDLNLKEDKPKEIAEFVETRGLIDAVAALGNNDTTFTAGDKRTRIDRIFIKRNLQHLLQEVSLANLGNLDHKTVTLTLGHAPPVKLYRFKQALPKSKLGAVINRLQIDDLDVPVQPTWKEWKHFKQRLRKRLKELTFGEAPNQTDAMRIEAQKLFNFKTLRTSDIPYRMIQITRTRMNNQQAFHRVNTGSPHAPTTSTEEGMVEAIGNFYAKLYEAQPTDPDALNQLHAFLPPTRDPSFFDSLTDPFTEEEVLNALQEMKPWKAPGPDGIHTKVYKKIQSTIAAPLAHLFNNMLKGDRIAPDFKSGVTILLMKAGDPADPGNRRPITLLNVDFKSLSKILVTRLKPFLHSIISSPQSGFIPGRSILNNILAVDLAHREFPNLHTHLYDFRKAYDSISFTSLIHTMHRIGFPHLFCNLIRNMIIDSHTRCIVNGNLTHRVNFQQGVKQGDPLSPILFNIAIEPLSRALQRCLQPKIYPRVLLYADDIAILADPTEPEASQEADQIDALFKLAHRGIGLQLNTAKCVTIANKEAPTDRFKVSQSERYLGYQLSPQGIEPNFEAIIAKAAGTLSQWKQRGSSPSSNAAIVKTFGLSKLWFQSTLSPISENANIQIQNVIDWFMWSPNPTFTPGLKTRRHMSLQRSHMTSQEGGLQLFSFPHRFIAIKAAFMSKLIADAPEWLWPLIQRHVKKKSRNIKNLMTTQAPTPIAAIASQSPLIGCLKAWKVASDMMQDSEPDDTDQARDAFDESIQHLIATPDIPPPSSSNPLSTKTINNSIADSSPTLTKWQRETEEKYKIKIKDFFKHRNSFPTFYTQKRVIERFFNSTLPYKKRAPCVFCNLPISRWHMFFECEKAKTTAEKLIKRIHHEWNYKDPSSAPDWNPQLVLSTFTNPLKRKKITITLAITFWIIWIHRCKRTHNDPSLPMNNLITMALNNRKDIADTLL